MYLREVYFLADHKQTRGQRWMAESMLLVFLSLLFAIKLGHQHTCVLMQNQNPINGKEAYQGSFEGNGDNALAFKKTESHL